jgi:quercetin dioxygenase-like cupin family protein
VQDQDLSIPGRHAVQAKAEFDPGGAVGRPTHPGEELSIVLEGALVLEIDGQPARTVKAGESFFIPAGVVHAGKNAGTGKAVVFATYIVEKGKPSLRRCSKSKRRLRFNSARWNGPLRWWINARPLLRSTGCESCP